MPIGSRSKNILGSDHFDFDVKVILGLLTIETNNSAFEAKVIICLESTRLDGWGPKTRLNGSHDQQGKGLKIV